MKLIDTALGFHIMGYTQYVVGDSLWLCSLLEGVNASSMEHRLRSRGEMFMVSNLYFAILLGVSLLMH